MQDSSICWLCQQRYTYDFADARHRDGAPCLDCQQGEAIPGLAQPLWELAAAWVRTSSPEVPFWVWVRQQRAAEGDRERVAKLAAETHARYGTTEAWGSIRHRIFARDHGRCDACGWDLSPTPEHARCTHVVDRAVGGTDDDDNLVVLCADCAQEKPIHASRAAYDTWRDSGGWLGGLLRAAHEIGS
jgi:5-methylcytosine-specific restriction protein A